MTQACLNTTGTGLEAGSSLPPNKQLIWQRQQEVLFAQRDELASGIRDAATASARCTPPRQPPTAPAERSEATFVEAVDADCNPIVSENDLSDCDNPLYKDGYFQAVTHRSEECLEASELPVERRVDIDVNDAIAKAAARPESEAAPG